MTTVIDELKQYALMEANKLKATLPSENDSKIKTAYQRAKDFDDLICPRCWVNDGEHSKLEVVARAQESDVYACAKCEIQLALPKEKLP